MASISKRPSKSGMTYRIQVKIKDKGSGEIKVHSTTWKPPVGLTPKQMEREVVLFAAEYENAIKALETASGEPTQSAENTFSDYALWWLKRRKNEVAASYFVNCESAIELTNKHIGGYKLKELTPNIIQQYYDKLDRMEKTVTVVTAKPTLRERMNQTGIGYMKLRYEKNFSSCSLEVAPASIIITTLAARIYDHEIDILTLFEKIIKEIPNRIENRDGTYWVSNPVNLSENFADKWKNDKKKQESFFDWVKKVNSDFTKLMKCQTSDELLSCLYSMFGQKIVDLTNNSLGGYKAIVPKILNESTEIIPVEFSRALAVPHRRKTPWKLPPWNIVQIEATAQGKYSTRKISSGEPLEKGLKLTFKAIHGIQSPYMVKWQITNTGYEAQMNDSLRGDFYNCDPETQNIRTEDTAYSGIHYVQCFIIKKKKCVAKSKEFIVKIK